jgi:hypothetical protein
MFVQKGIGAMIRRRLRYAGVDLNDQSRNQRLARVGSIAGSLATIDMSMASDTVASSLVEALLPPDWFDALEQCRSQSGVLPSSTDYIQYEKFSSMGNGYTFELESLIFYGLALAVREAYRVEDTRVAVYGDDIVVPTAMAQPLCSLLEEVGFTVNEEKSFITGPFRESCGKHYFQGHDVTPFYVRRPVVTLSDLFLLHNNFYRWLCRMKWANLDEASFRPLIEQLRGVAPANWRRPRIPDNFGDGAFIGTFDESTPIVAKRGWEGFTVHLLTEKSESKEFSGIGRLISSLYTLDRLAPDQEYLVSINYARRWVVRKHHLPQYALEDPFN